MALLNVTHFGKEVSSQRVVLTLTCVCVCVCVWVSVFFKQEPSSLWIKATFQAVWMHLLTWLGPWQQMWYDNSIRQDAKYWDKPKVTLKKKISGQSVPVCVSALHSQLLELNHFHMGSMKTLQSLPQYMMRRLYLDLDQQRKGGEVEGRRVRALGEGCGLGGGLQKSLHLNIIKT